MKFNWENWLALFLVGNQMIPYLWDIEFYDTGIKENYIEEVE